jgi:hypothetical protein
MEKQFTNFEKMILAMCRASYSINQSIDAGLKMFEWLKDVGDEESPSYSGDKYRRALEDCLNIYQEIEHLDPVQAVTYAGMMANAVNPYGSDGVKFQYGDSFFIYRTAGGLEFEGRMFGAFWVGHIRHPHLTKANSTLRASLEAAGWEFGAA